MTGCFFSLLEKAVSDLHVKVGTCQSRLRKIYELLSNSNRPQRQLLLKFPTLKPLRQEKSECKKGGPPFRAALPLLPVGNAASAVGQRCGTPNGTSSAQKQRRFSDSSVGSWF